MKKTISINIGGYAFIIDEDAFQLLKSYLDKLEKHFYNQSGGKEIINDIEQRIAELFKEKLSSFRQVICSADVQEIIQILGYPEEMDGHQAYSEPLKKPSSRLYRDPDDRILGGVSSGLAAYIGTDAWLIRVLFVLAFFFVFGGMLYIVLWIIIPLARTRAEKLEMRGEPVNINNIKDSIKQEFDQVMNNFQQKK